jgi:ankyrin repeat protein
MPTQQLPSNPSLENLRKQAKSLRKAVVENDPDASARVREFHPHADDAIRKFSLSDAQLVTARTYGFSSWAKLKQYLDVLDQHSFLPPKKPDDSEPLADQFVHNACLDYSSDHTTRHVRARELFAQNPSLSKENIYTAVTVGEVATVREMLSKNKRLAKLRGGPHNWEPLLYAAYSRLNSEAHGHSTLEVARLLLDHGADPNAGFLWDSHYLFTALTGAFGEGEGGPIHQPEHQYCYPLARLLLERGADPNDSQTLYNRMFTGDTKHLELLFEFGLGKGGDGIWFQRLGSRSLAPAEMLQQLLGWAAKYNHFERLRLLVDKGVDVNTPDTRLKRTPYELAILHGNTAIAQYLLEHGAQRTYFNDADEFAAACLAGDEAKASSLLKANPKLIQQLGHRRIELLHLAAESKKPGAIRLMQKLGFDLNAVSRTAPLHHAAMAGDLEMTKLLIELGANPLVRDWEFNATPSGWAQYGDKLEVVEYLKQFEKVE